MVQHCQATQVQGGFGRVFLAIVESLRNEQLHLGIPMSFGQTMTLFVAEIQHWIGDLDALRVSFDAKGSAGLRVCIKCENVLKRDSGVPACDDRFVEVACSKVELFDPQSDHEIFQVVDDLLMKKIPCQKTSCSRWKWWQASWPTLMGCSQIQVHAHFALQALGSWM